MPTRSAFAHPVALSLLLIGCLVAVILGLLPAARLWAVRAPLILGWSLGAYAASVAVVHRSRRVESSPELGTLVSIRRAIAERLAEQRADDHHATELVHVLQEAIEYIDDQLIPALGQVLDRQRILSKHLGRYDRGELPEPDQAVLDRLLAISARQRRAIDECVRQAVNADAVLIALLQEADETSLIVGARTWSVDLMTLYDSLSDVLQGPQGIENRHTFLRHFEPLIRERACRHCRE